jgi:hypothetical protein
MKIIYMLLKVPEIIYQGNNTSKHKVEATRSKLSSVFQATVNELIRYGKEEASVGLDYGDMYVGLRITRGDDVSPQGEALPEYTPEGIPYPLSLIYLPAQEFLSINEGFIAAYNKRELPYDETYYDLSLALNALPLRNDKLVEVQEIIAFLQQLIAGEQIQDAEVVTQENGRFKFSLPEGQLDVHLVAEGYRKIATLLYLLKNGSLTKDSILFWDEPEANLNPKLVVDVVKVLRELAAAGMQIFVATHDYLLSHELSLLAEYPSEESVTIKFFALHKPNRKSGVLIETGQTLAEIEHNPILAEFAAHYDREAALFHTSELVGS